MLVTARILRSEFTFILHFVIFCGRSSLASKVDYRMGVPKERLHIYLKGSNFTCLNGEKAIPFEYINDDYCDCTDGSDEPGTSACSETGRFYCRNEGHKEMMLLSSRVNDFVCDCCDGSDEYSGHVQCPNTCTELGRAAREEADRLSAAMREGYQKRVLLIEQGLAQKVVKQKIIEDLKSQIQELSSKINALEDKKKSTEALEKDAKEKCNQKWEAEKAEFERKAEVEHIETVFKELDNNHDDKITVEEVQKHMQFDTDNDGIVSREEALEWLKLESEVNRERFYDTIWPHIKDVYKKDKSLEPEPDAVKEEDEEEEDFIDEDQKEKDAEEMLEMPEYDDETKRLIDEADTVRDQYNQVDRQFRDVEQQLRDAEDFISKDLGKDFEFAELASKCFELTDIQYTYRLCLFEKATQRSKSGGSETTLGRWGKWSGPENNLYTRQRYEGGSSCWNGPDRSVEVILHCGSENKIISSSEPSRCEYLFEFETPAACTELPDPGDFSSHKETAHVEL